MTLACGIALRTQFLRPASAQSSVVPAAQPALPASSPAPAPSPAADLTVDPCGGATRLLATLNRPTIGYSTCAVPAGSVFLEEGYQNGVAGTTPSQTIAGYPQGFERFGIANRFELDLIGPAYNRQRTDDSFSSGYTDFGLGFKYELPQRGRFTYAFDGIFTAATGARGWSAGAPTQTANLDVACALSPALGIGTTLALQAGSGYDGVGNRMRYGAFLPSVVVTAQIPNAYQFYVELVGLTKLGPGAGGRVLTDFGVQKLFNPNFEIDVEYGAGLSAGAAASHYVGAGTGIRL